MADICLERAVSGVSSPTDAAVCKPLQRATRRRQKLVGGDAALKKRRFEIRPSSACDSTGLSGVASVNGNRPKISYGSTSVVGRRRDMEDAVSTCTDFVRDGVSEFHFFGVFDGHGCSHVAVLCKDRMHEIVSSEMSSSHLRSDAGDLNWDDIMQKSFYRMDEEAVTSPGGEKNVSCKCELRTPKCNHVGSTAVVSVVSDSKIIVANCGDSRAVLCRRGEAPIALSVDHKPDRPDELKRIEESGGRVIYWDGARVLGVLAMSRAIGDGYLKPYVIAEPEVTITERTENDECLILASDGLWDVVSNEMASDIAKMCLRGSRSERDADDAASRSARSKKACSDAAMLLTKLALARNSSDNVSVIVVDLRKIL